MSTITDSGYISAVEAGQQFGYTNDYVTRLAREKKVVAVRVGKQWYVDAKSLELFVAKSDQVKKEYAERLRAERKRERKAGVSPSISPDVAFIPLPNPRVAVLAKAGMIVSVVAIAAGFIFSHAPSSLSGGQQQIAGVSSALRGFVVRLHEFGSDGNSGVITPIFKNSSSAPYRYLMVPMESAQRPP